MQYVSFRFDIKVFTLEMSYTASGNIATKNVTADILSADNTVTQLAYQGNYSYTSGKPHAIEYINGTDIDQAFTWDLNGNLSTHTDNIKSLNRYLCWDEENRLMAVKDQNYLSAYIYDAAGERVWKLSGEVTQMKISGKGTIDVASLNNKTLYVSPYVVYNEQGYSKHYYAGAERVSSRIGGGTMYGLKHPINDTVSTITAESGYPELSENVWLMLERSFSDCLDLYTDYIGYEPHLESVQESASQNNPEPNWYIYHSDHLGSSSFLTDANGDPTQHLQYLPFGENYIEQRATTDYYTPYTFSAKERDPETGYSYFGARYYDPNVSVWLSVDPMADKYPYQSGYCYVGWRPLMMIDPNGLWEQDADGNWIAKKGDSWWSLHQQSGMSWKETMSFAKSYNAARGKDNWKFVGVGDKVTLPGSVQKSGSSNRNTKSSAAPSGCAKTGASSSSTAKTSTSPSGNNNASSNKTVVPQRQEGKNIEPPLTVSFNRGIPQIETNFTDKQWGAVTPGPFIIYSKGGSQDPYYNTHEPGHVLQFYLLGPAYYTLVAIPSLISSTTPNHSDMPWERSANQLWYLVTGETYPSKK